MIVSTYQFSRQPTAIESSTDLSYASTWISESTRNRPLALGGRNEWASSIASV